MHSAHEGARQDGIPWHKQLLLVPCGCKQTHMHTAQRRQSTPQCTAAVAAMLYAVKPAAAALPTETVRSVIPRLPAPAMSMLPAHTTECGSGTACSWPQTHIPSPSQMISSQLVCSRRDHSSDHHRQQAGWPPAPSLLLHLLQNK